MSLKSCERIENLSQANLALTDSLHHSHDKYGNLVTSTAVIMADNKTFRKKIHSQDTTIRHLQEIAAKYKKDLISATTVVIVTHVSGTASTTVLPGDTVRVGDTTYIYPEYSAQINQPWGLKMNLKMSKLTTQYDIEMLNRMDIITRYHRKKFLAAKESTIEITTYNPNSGIAELKSYHVEQPKKYSGLKVLLGALIGGTIVAVVK